MYPRYRSRLCPLPDSQHNHVAMLQWWRAIPQTRQYQPGMNRTTVAVENVLTHWFCVHSVPFWSGFPILFLMRLLEKWQAPCLRSHSTIELFPPPSQMRSYFFLVRETTKRIIATGTPMIIPRVMRIMSTSSRWNPGISQFSFLFSAVLWGKNLRLLQVDGSTYYENDAGLPFSATNCAREDVKVRNAR